MRASNAGMQLGGEPLGTSNRFEPRYVAQCVGHARPLNAPTVSDAMPENAGECLGHCVAIH